MLENPSEIVDLLATSLPSASAYFIQILVAQTCILQAVEMLRVYQLGLAGLRKLFGPGLTKRERRRPWCGLYPLEEPPEFWHAETLAQHVLYFVVLFVYAPIAPITSFFVLFCFVLLESSYRYQLFHNIPLHDTGGKLWLSFIQFVLGCLVIAQLTLIGLLLLKQSPFAGPAMGPLLCVTARKSTRHDIVPLMRLLLVILLSHIVVSLSPQCSYCISTDATRSSRCTCRHATVYLPTKNMRLTTFNSSSVSIYNQP